MCRGWFQSKASSVLKLPSVAKRVRRARLHTSRSRCSRATSFSQVSTGEARPLVHCSSSARMDSFAARKPTARRDSTTSLGLFIVALQRVGNDVAVADVAAELHVERHRLVGFAAPALADETRPAGVLRSAGPHPGGRAG